MNQKKIKPIPYNMPIVQKIDEVHFGNQALLNHKGDRVGSVSNRMIEAERDFFDLTLPSFLPVENQFVSPEDRKRAEEIRGFNTSVLYLQSQERKEILGQVLRKEINPDDVLEEEIKHTHPTFQPWEHQTLDAYVLKYSTNMLLTHEVRVGKTITATLGAYNNQLAKKILILCPKIVVFDAWVKTFTEWTDLKVTTYLSESTKKKQKERDENFEAWKKGDIDVLVCNIDFFTLKYDTVFKKLSTEERENLLIVDEGHFLSKRTQTSRQGLSSKRSESVVDYRTYSEQNNPKPRFAWILTGTPARNYEYEILSLYYALHPIKYKSKRGDYLDCYSEFFNRFGRLSSVPSSSNNYRFEVDTGHEYQTALEEMNSLHRLHRNQKDLWGDPDKYNVYTDKIIEPTKGQDKIYKAIADNLKLFTDYDSPLVRDNLFRQVAVDHRLLERFIVDGVDTLLNHEDKFYAVEEVSDILDRDIEVDELQDTRSELLEVFGKDFAFDKKGAKATWVIDWIKENKERIQGNKKSDEENLQGVKLDDPEYRTKQLQGRQPVVLFSFFTSFLKIFKKDLEKEFGDDLVVEIIEGSVTGQKRQEIVDRFQNGEIDILICQTIAMSEGVTLNRGDQAIFFDRVWENTKMEQVKARIHNPSKPYPKEEIFLMLENSIDYIVAEANNIKAENVKYVNKEIVNSVHGMFQDKLDEFFRNFMTTYESKKKGK